MVLVKNWLFIHLFLGNIGQENAFYNILEQKNVLLGYKNKNFKKTKNWDFTKEVSTWFWSKLTISPSFFIGDIRQEKGFYNILERKIQFLGYTKKKTSKRQKTEIVQKGLVHGFDQKLAIFLSFFRNYGPGKSHFRYSRTRKRLSRF